MKKQIRPTYYDRFHCIAGECDFTCCQEWKIAVDDATNQKWKKQTPPPGMRTRRKKLSQFTQFKDGQRVVALERNGVCPFLNEDKFCRLVITYGEECLSNTCHIFPREKHEFEDRIEYSLMPCCPYAVDLLKEEEAFGVLSEYEREADDADSSAKAENPVIREDPMLFQIRDFLVELVQRADISAEEGMKMSFFILNSFLTQEGLTIAQVAKDIPELLAAMRSMPVDEEDHFIECNELFLDLIDNYRREGIYDCFLTPLGNRAEEISAEQNMDALCPDFEKAWADWQPLIKKLLAEEFYADLLIPEGDLESMVVKCQWIAMEYVLLKELCLLQMSLEDAEELTYKQLRDFIVLSSRMMGYEEEDIYSYMENSFEDLIWDFGYLALILGKG